MTASKRETIMAYLATQAAGITAVNGYNTTVATVERWIAAPELADNVPADFPLIILEEGSEVIELEPSQMAMTEMSFTVHACLKGTTSVVTPTTLNAFIEDVKQFIEAKHTANGTAVDIVVATVDVQHEPDIAYAAARLHCVASYYHSVSQP